jgi:nicotinate-nucleotide adenylyltransferase
LNRAAGPAIGVFGGTFDPVHFGHLRPALEVGEALALHQVRMLPSAQPPHRGRPSADAAHRLAMLERAVAGQSLLCVDDCELRRGGPSYMVHTLQHFRESHPESPLILIVGQDAARGLDTWYRWADLFDLAHLVVMGRPGPDADYGDALGRMITRRAARSAEELHRQPAGLTFSLPVSQLDISATSIRNKVRAGRSIAYLTPPAVADYIADHGLYADRPCA